MEKLYKRFARGWLVLVVCVFAILDTATAADPHTIPPTIQKQLQLPEERIDIGLAALTFAKEFYPHLDIATYSQRIDLIADKARQLAQGTEDPETRIRILNTVIHQMEGFHYDRSPFARSRQDYRFLRRYDYAGRIHRRGTEQMHYARARKRSACRPG